MVDEHDEEDGAPNRNVEKEQVQEKMMAKAAV